MAHQISRGRPGLAALFILHFALGICLLLAGCAARPWQHTAWQGGPEHGRTLLTTHYALHTTIEDERFLSDLAQSMEEAHELYARLAPLSRRVRPKHGFIYAYRDEWAEYTEATAGTLAPVYLQIHRGGYAHGDVFATFYHGHPQTLAVCRHEGWHQYVASGFERRLPPSLEEGLATLFEAGFQDGDLRRPRPNGTRQLRLADAVRHRRAWPLRELLRMHAGNVIGREGQQIDTFYAQTWALARFLLEEEAYHDGFMKMLAAYADGSVGGRSPAAAMQKYLGVPFDQIERDYQRFARKLAGLDRPD